MSIASCGLGELDRALFSPKEVQRLLSISHASFYRLVADGRLDARKIGTKTVVTALSIEKLIESLPKVGE
jgi:hypothetical protein